ncbi:alpha/beta hydrolase [Nocardia implantans]|uniref:Alpha/beta hydrolase n=1 Tax=Nocardia implantans TaxID=3108168 RepID=A0ABU6B175_9NOCA|nr:MULTISPECIES: alpha/beta hydrolase [unclassified Nocardia]MBF6195607.1 alpha/beta hydrolase [Nocardia beijingensis]MEA3531308.1 alpha/beta hydrolase [Nocardia sp. CDC192]MEB3513482.1 alpha/beta hydrolase [Nocardia sp. CDC186]
MSPMDERHPSTVSDWDDARRRARLRDTSPGHGWKTLRRTRVTLLRVAALLLAGLVVFAQYWKYDVAPEQARLARTEPAILPVAPPVDPQNWDTVVVDLVGLGGLDAGDTAAALPALRRMGMVWAIRYDNQGIDTKVIADLVVRAAELSGLRNIVLVGHSMGGVIALEVAEHIHRDSDRRLVGVILDCTPVDLNAVRPESRGRGEDMLRWMGWLPGARESRMLRLAVETYARRDRFVDRGHGLPGVRLGELGEVLAEVMREKIVSRDAASNGLIESQFTAIVAGGATDDLRTLAQPVADKPRPAIVFIRPRDANADRVVDVEYSHRVLIEQSGGVDGTLLVVLARNTGHANPMQRPREYNTVIEQQILPFVQRYQQQVRSATVAAPPR